MGNIINGLEIANKHMKEKELLTSELYLELALEIAAIIEIFKLLGYEPTPYETQRFLIKAYIASDKKAEMILKNKKR